MKNFFALLLILAVVSMLCYLVFTTHNVRELLKSVPDLIANLQKNISQTSQNMEELFPDAQEEKKEESLSQKISELRNNLKLNRSFSKELDK